VAAPTQAERDAVVQFVHWIYGRAGQPGWGEFARRCEVLPSQMSDWQRGVNAPSTFNLLKMLRVAGVLSDGESSPAAPDFQQFGDRLRELEAVVDNRDTSILKSLKSLEAGVQRLEKRLDAQAPRSRRAK
jgi:hypothetical protein